MQHKFYEGQKVLCIKTSIDNGRWGIEGNIYTVKKIGPLGGLQLEDIESEAFASRFIPHIVKELDWNL